jgi:hypothetical protein
VAFDDTDALQSLLEELRANGAPGHVSSRSTSQSSRASSIS